MSIAPNSVAVPQQSKSLDTSTVTTGAGLVHRQIISIADPENQGQYARLSGSSLQVNVTNTTLAVTAAALPLPSGAATAAKQPALGAAGTPSADVISVQGISGGEPIMVEVVQPVTVKLAPQDWVHANTNAVVVAKTGAGILRRIVVNTKGGITNTLTIYDNTTATGAVIGVVDTGNAVGGSFDYELPFSTGLTFVMAGGSAADITVIFE